MRSVAVVGAVSLILLAIAQSVGAQDGAPPISTPVTERDLGLSADEIEKVQDALRDRGHDPGGSDGKIGNLTRRAIREFQERQKRPQTGYLDVFILSELLQPAESVQATSVNPPPEAQQPKPEELPAQEQPAETASIEAPEPQCTPGSSSAPCWMKIADQECYVWNPGSEANETVVWDGPARPGRATVTVRSAGGRLVQIRRRWSGSKPSACSRTDCLTAVGI